MFVDYANFLITGRKRSHSLLSHAPKEFTAAIDMIFLDEAIASRLSSKQKVLDESGAIFKTLPVEMRKVNQTLPQLLFINLFYQSIWIRCLSRRRRTSRTSRKPIRWEDKNGVDDGCVGTEARGDEERAKDATDPTRCNPMYAYYLVNQHFQIK